MRLLLVLMLAVGVVAGCSTVAGPGSAPGPSPTPSASPTPSPRLTPSPTQNATLPTLAIHRTGGFVGVDQGLEIGTNGRWTLTDGGQPTRTGRLDAAARTRLAAMLTNPDLPAEIAAIPRHGCCDQFDYELRIGDRTYTFEDLGDIGPLVQQLLAFLHEQTGF